MLQELNNIFFDIADILDFGCFGISFGNLFNILSFFFGCIILFLPVALIIKLIRRFS